MTSERVTMVAIAQAAGVSVPTVSRVLNGRDGVSPRTRERVEGLLRERGYRARHAQHSALIDVVFPEITCAWETEHIRGIEAAASAAGVGIVVNTLWGGGDATGQLLRRLRGGRTDGVILAAQSGTDAMRTALSSLNVPVVALDPASPVSAEIPTVDAANWAGGRSATRHLLGLGHRRIAMIAGAPNLRCSRTRLDGYRAALDEGGVAYRPDLVEHGNFDFGSALAAGLRLLDRADRPTAIFASCDRMALGVYEAARRRRIPIPERLSVVGFDDLPGASWASPPLTTVRQPLRDMGGYAAGALLSLVRGEPLTTPYVEMTTSLVIRESTAPPH
ncbi:LacI family transcriptional regulator [Actinoplanes ianthinogenes]|uniref:LacI family transcriptional regulator n=1 Tax=Actinoplanes ianthinogenes TaxID=122358 RepID=A0ABM7LPC7_9ACTN|nr:LacI family DNA-binding transcriptional regulator [Actinoplanes ianthinogenes]BCJ41060.1 LacI family transcriptional regulator [Actinoplanes ianthinogenes]GGR23167.1 LacI family transcriptional regulator [Actinoplanes ianthinogenes]